MEAAPFRSPDLLGDLRARIDTHILGLLLDRTPPAQVVRHLLRTGGKRLRPLLVHLGGQVVDAPVATCDELSAAAELVHVASLLHDDLIDQAIMRRGAPAAWHAHGVGVAVLAGDQAYTRALVLVAETAPTALASLVETIEEMVRGQALELAAVGSFSGEWEVIATGKTAALCAWCARAGALSSGDGLGARSLSIYGRQLGLAFQAIDDLADLVPGADPGKRPWADLQARIPSLPIRCAVAEDTALAEEIAAYWQGTGPLEELGPRVLQAGGPPTVERARGWLDGARAALNCFANLPARGALEHLVSVLDERLEHLQEKC